ncbi:MAG: EAL domain-containing protein [Devosia sp.]|nr:EAL domain-containing protein [Devosia sp.]
MGEKAGAFTANAQEELRLLTLAVNETERAVYVTDAHGILIYANRTFSEIFGHATEEVLGRPVLELLGQSDYDAATMDRLLALVRRGRTFQEEVWAHDRLGNELWLLATVRPVLSMQGQLENLVCVLENTTESRQIQTLQRDVLEAVAQDLPLRQVANLICKRVEKIFPEVVSSILSIDPDKRLRPLALPSLPQYYAQAIDGLPIGPDVGSCGTSAYRGVPVVTEDIETDPLWADYRGLVLPLGLHACWSSPIKLRDGRVAGTFAFYFRQKRGPSNWHEHIVAACLHLCVVAFERHEAKERIDKLAYYDTLTGLPNRALLREQIDAAFRNARPDRQMAFLFLDVDNFKDVNDTLGHSVGDELLVEIAKRLREQLRPGDLVSRHGGDEFVIMLDNCDGDRAGLTADGILDALLRPLHINGLSLPVTASIGISLHPEDGTDSDTLLKNADAAMYQAKSERRATHRFFNRQMNQMGQDRVLLGAALREAVAEHALHLRYQPQISARDGKLLGVEALARWTHPALGEIVPDRFIRLAEQSGLIEAIGEWALEEACRQLKAWDARDLKIPCVSVNISPIHFRNRELLPVVAATLQRHGLSADRLLIEITEGVVMDGCPIAMENTRALQSLGIRLSMDDFGTGYSSLSHLARLPVTELKIDRSFITELEESVNAQTLVTAVIRIGQSLGLTMVAEGVETEAQRRFLQALECDVLQGFLFSKALPPSEFESWFAAYEAGPASDKVRGAA